jgi:hypothetical protein
LQFFSQISKRQSSYYKHLTEVVGFVLRREPTTIFLASKIANFQSNRATCKNLLCKQKLRQNYGMTGI